MKRSNRFDLFSAIVLGILLALLVWHVYDTGYFQQWEKLPRPPANVTKFITVELRRVFIATADGHAFYCSDYGKPCWTQDDIFLDYHPSEIVALPCISSSPEFLLFANPPQNGMDCAHYQGSANEASLVHTVVLDKNGDIWFRRFNS